VLPREAVPFGETFEERIAWTKRGLRSGAAELRETSRRSRLVAPVAFADDYLEARSGFPLRLVWAKSSSCFSLIDIIDLDAPLSLLFGVSPRLAA
jgi:hypothetical protein